MATVVMLAVACDDGTPKRAGSNPSTSTSSTGGGTSLTIGIICSAPSDAAMSLVDAWVAGDRAAAGRCANTDVVASLFASTGKGAGWVFSGCDLSDPGVPVCSYRYSGGSAKLKIEGTEARGWKVTKIDR